MLIFYVEKYSFISELLQHWYNFFA